MERFLIRYVLFGAEHSAERQTKEKKIWEFQFLIWKISRLW